MALPTKVGEKEAVLETSYCWLVMGIMGHIAPWTLAVFAGQAESIAMLIGALWEFINMLSKRVGIARVSAMPQSPLYVSIHPALPNSARKSESSQRGFV